MPVKAEALTSVMRFDVEVCEGGHAREGRGLDLCDEVDLEVEVDTLGEVREDSVRYLSDLVISQVHSGGILGDIRGY